jgi:hypothetical protein
VQADEAGLPDMDTLLGQHVDLANAGKIGEGTFGEAFKAGDYVLKIVPMEGQKKARLLALLVRSVMLCTPYTNKHLAGACRSMEKCRSELTRSSPKLQ